MKSLTELLGSLRIQLKDKYEGYLDDCKKCIQSFYEDLTIQIFAASIKIPAALKFYHEQIVENILIHPEALQFYKDNYGETHSLSFNDFIAGVMNKIK